MITVWRAGDWEVPAEAEAEAEAVAMDKVLYHR
jgi:hypothetical protein